MKVNACKLFHWPVPGVFTPRSLGWNNDHQHIFFPPGTLDQTPGPRNDVSRPGWYGRLQLHVPWVHGLPLAAIPAGPTGRRLGALGYANRPRLGRRPRPQPSAHPKCPPPTRSRLRREGGWIRDAGNYTRSADAKLNTGFHDDKQSPRHTSHRAFVRRTRQSGWSILRRSRGVWNIEALSRQRLAYSFLSPCFYDL